MDVDLKTAKMIGAEELMANQTELDSIGTKPALQGLKILLVEDSLDNQYLLSTFLKNLDARVEIKSNGVEAVEFASKGNYDLVLMDIQMPVMDGHAATQKLRQLHFDKPIVALTAHAMNEEKRRCFSSGFTDYLTKPIDLKVLLNVLHRYLPFAERAG